MYECPILIKLILKGEEKHSKFVVKKLFVFELIHNNMEKNNTEWIQ